MGQLQTRARARFGVFRLLQLPEELLLAVFCRLAARDLASLSRTCTVLERLVTAHLHSRLACLLHTHPATALPSPWELQLAVLRDTAGPPPRPAILRLLAKTPGQPHPVTRVSCIDTALTFHPPNDREYPGEAGSGVWAGRYYDSGLGRQVMRVERVRWLRMVHTWKDVPASTYQIGIRVRAESSFNWPHRASQASVVRLVWDGGDSSCNLRLKRTLWRAVAGRRTHSGIPPFRMERDGISDWVCLLLPVFTTQKKNCVILDLIDSECNFWKGGLSFDSVELRKLKSVKPDHDSHCEQHIKG